MGRVDGRQGTGEAVGREVQVFYVGILNQPRGDRTPEQVIAQVQLRDDDVTPTQRQGQGTEELVGVEPNVPYGRVLGEVGAHTLIQWPTIDRRWESVGEGAILQYQVVEVVQGADGVWNGAK